MTTNPAPTTAQVPHAQKLIMDKVPAWLTSATPETLKEMRTLLRTPDRQFARACAEKPATARHLADDHQAYRAALGGMHTLLAALPDLQHFAAQRLGSAIKARFDLDLDVTRTYLFNASKAAAFQASMAADPIIDAQRAFKLATQSLLHCALQNFEADEAQPGGMDTDTLQSVVLDSDAFLGPLPSGNVVQIRPDAFAALVRELDIGGQYNASVDALYGEPNQPIFNKAEHCAFRLAVHRAYLGDMIDASLHAALLTLVDEGQAEHASGYIRCAFLKLFDIPLTGALVIGVVPSPEQLLWYDATLLPFKQLLVTYLPGAPTPLKAHPSVHAVQAYLRDQLWAMEAGHLQQAVPARDSATFMEKLQDCLQPVDMTTFTALPGHQGGQVRRVRDPDAWVPVTLQPLNLPLLDALVSQKQQRARDDAQFHAVPTALEDQKSAAKRRAYFEQLGLIALNIGAFFVPGLGQVMLGLSAIQLSYEVFEGIESWADGDQAQALGYLMDVVDNIALMAALGAAGAGNGTPVTEHIPVETPSFIEELEPVTLPNGDSRLWLPDLRPFAHDTVLPAGLEPDEFGLYHHEGKTWLALEDKIYSLKKPADNDLFSLVHPTRPLSYEPPLRHNGAGAWLHPLDNPEQWQELALFRRAGHLNAKFDDETALRILRVSDTREEVLRQVLSESQRLPGQLQDTMVRFALYQELDPAEPDLAHTVFEKRYQALPAPQLPGAELIHYRYPQLPPAVTEELLRNITASDQAELLGGTVPRRLAEEIRLLQQQVRLNRAYEGLYLPSVRNWDSDLLVLHSLEHLRGWPADLHITLEQRLNSPSQRGSIGPAEAPQRKTIVSARTGYLVTDDASPDQTLVAHGSLYGALFDALTQTQREALAVQDAQALEASVLDLPLLPRSALRKVLAMQDIGPGFRSPMRLANGRIGYPLGGTRPRVSSISRQSLLSAIRQIGLHTPVTRPADQTLAHLENRHMTRAAINDLLQGLLEQRNQLQSRLTSWRHLAERMPHQSPDDFERLLSAISQHWYDHAFASTTETAAPLRLEHLSLLDFPLDLPEFFTAGITDLQLIDTSPAQFEGWNQHAGQLNHLLRQFPNLRALHISRPYRAEAAPSPFLFSLPLIAQHLPALESLALTHQNISLSTTDIDSLATLPGLRRLDLSGNRLSEEYPPAFNELRLDYLGLDDMHLDHWPGGLGHNAIVQTGHISLRNNRIRVLPRLLMSNRINVADHAQLSLQGNPLFDDDMRRVLLNEDGRAARFEMDQTAEFRQQIALALEQRQQLRDAIDNYVNASSSTTLLSQAVLTSRMRIATALTDFWHDQEIGLTRSPLRLTGISLEQFPAHLPDFFMGQVHNLTLERVSGSTAQLSTLLARFPQVRRLTIEDHQQAQQTLPSALLRLPNLTELALRNCELQIDQDILDTLAQLLHLDTLDLSGNRMGEISTTPQALQSLRRLDLNQMRLRQWPAWVDSLLPLEMLDLSENRLTDLPPHILANLDNDLPISSILLLGNPLTDDAFYRARASSDSQRSFTFAMDAPGSWDESEWLGHFHAPLLDTIDDRPSLDDWLLASEVENEALRDTWKELEDSGTANDLLLLLGRLKNTGTYRDASNRRKLCERVRKVLVHTLVNPDERAAINIQASEALTRENGSQTCHDGVLTVFQGLEDHIENERSQIDAADSEANLYRHVRRLYRVQAVDKVARSETGDRDQAEVRLTYRRELNVPLELGLPEERLLYAVNLGIEERTDAELQVQLGELGEEFLHFAEGNELWVSYLRRTHAQWFADIERSYQQQVAELPDQYPDRSIDSLSAEFEALARSKKARESRLIRELTSFANPDRKPRASSN
ncbi:hypothetical protein PMI38_03421 [Pseudomonas sp. GM84]|uniref:dermonecrotic toxin domain-containing protein n=1 Tax=Pseudomonas sp. GM84 TaxID=1144340 RepID=UPI00026F93DC|nr:DUF6543 domain-containing protein [Pseudomonas sp. GM84]EJN37149.1 hypothetical protein PMI38_03421 [Pseudomonas sp. GM84]